MPMNENFTEDIELLEHISLKLISLLEKLPDSYFEKECFTPSKEVVDGILNFSKTIKPLYYLNIH